MSLEDLQNPISATIKSATGLVNAVGKVGDDWFTSDEERLILRNELEQNKTQLELAIRQLHSQYRIAKTEAVTARHAADMKSDSWLAKNIRPIALIWVLSLMTIVVFRPVSGETLALLGTVTSIVTSFYFHGRTSEKRERIKKD